MNFSNDSNKSRQVSGFSKLSKRKKIKWVVENFFKDPEGVSKELMSFIHPNNDQQRVIDGFSENTISNFVLPLGIAPNFKIDDKVYCVPMVTEESSVVAAASSAAKFWLNRGGFKTKIVSTTKVGQVHFTYKGNHQKLNSLFLDLKRELIEGTAHITNNMTKRGGGILDIELLDMTHLDADYFQLKGTFETCDSMGANFINSVLEEFAKILTYFVENHPALEEDEKHIDIIMSILSNYTPECLVRAWVECPVSELGVFPDNMSAEAFSDKFCRAIKIALLDVHRATTHNKGIFNGIDAVVIATGNDFRAIEACGHTYAAKDGQYRSLTHCEIKDGVFKFWIDLPIALGTVGGLTSLHPLARRSLELLGNPSAEELMSIIACTGLAQNFAAVKSLVTTGIQKGHMKMHLINILNHMEATEKEMKHALKYFKDKVVSFTAVREFLNMVRTNPVTSGS